jgi:hypothetical protein
MHEISFIGLILIAFYILCAWLLVGWLLYHLCDYIMNIKGYDQTPLKKTYLILLGPIGIVITIFSLFKKDLKQDNQRSKVAWFFANPFRLIIGLVIIAVFIMLIAYINTRCEYPWCFNKGTEPVQYMYIL